VTADDKSMTAGDAVPGLTFAAAGLVGADDPSDLGPVTCSTTATTAPVAGAYPITCAGADSVNYTVTYVAGQLTVTSATPPPTPTPTPTPTSTPRPTATAPTDASPPTTAPTNAAALAGAVAQTGSNVDGFAVIAALALLVGGLLLVGGRRRRRTHG
jgi:LPXTG-motif cell wall-anchored protein